MTPEIDYLVSSTAWSLGGLLVGYVLGRIEHDVRDIKRILTRERNRRDHT